MADEIPAIQILDKKNYFQQTLLPLPNALPYPALGPSSLRLRTSVLSLTVNNFTYAALGTLRNWWDVHPLPPSTPAPYNDASKYGRINAWGYAEVLESTVPEVPKGSYLWGYVPLGTLPQDLEVELHPNGNIADQIFVTNAYRRHLMSIYNRYFVYPASSSSSPIGAEIAQKTSGVAYDALLRVMHATAFLMARFAFSADPARTIDPVPGPDDDAVQQQWGAQNADLRDATVLVFAPGSKAALAFAALLRARDGAEEKQDDDDDGRPARIVGVPSEASKAFVEGTGLYDAVAPTSSDPAAALRNVGHEEEEEDGGKKKKIVIFDFGGRDGIAMRWAAALAPSSNNNNNNLLYVRVGSGIIDPSKGLPAAGASQPPFTVAQVSAGDMRRRAMKRVGEERYWAEEMASWEKFRREGIKGFGVNWGEGMEDVIRGWDRLARGEVLPSEGLVYKL
ncbi:hypothetical protein F5Y19DRAFT_226761 [Xylariaceae sp. FL1651]|nr:hypothetical protein F5Y19DRAFT_226761 [Xylariaceae sp. FL1651]